MTSSICSLSFLQLSRMFPQFSAIFPARHVWVIAQAGGQETSLTRTTRSNGRLASSARSPTWGSIPSGKLTVCYGKWHIEIDGLPVYLLKMLIFYSYVKLPEGNWWYDLTWSGWRLSFNPLKNVIWSVGMMTFPTEWKNKSHVPNH